MPTDGRMVDAVNALQAHTAHWITYTPVVSSTAGTITSYTSKGNYLLLAPKLVFIQMNVNITNAGTGSGTLQATLPISFDPGNILSTLNGLETTMNLPADGIMKSGDPTRINIYVFGSSVSVALSGTTSGTQNVLGSSEDIGLGAPPWAVITNAGVGSPVNIGVTDGTALTVSATGSGTLTYSTYAGQVNNNINLSGFYAIK